MRWGAIGRLAGPLLVVVAVWLVAGWLPATLSSVDEELVDAQDNQLSLAADLEAARALPDRADAIGQRLSAAQGAVPETVDLAAFVRTMAQLSTESGVAIEQLAPLAVGSDTESEALIRLPAGTSSVTMSVGATGSYGAAMGFVERLRQLERLVLIDLIGLTADEESSGQITMELEIRIFTTEELILVPELDDELLDPAAEDLEVAGEEEAT